MKFLLLSVPVLDLQYPPSSPAIIKSCLLSAGHEASVFDTNILVYNLARDSQHFVELSNLFEVCGTSTQWNNYTEALFDTEHDIINQWLDIITNKISDVKPDWLGISVFSYKSHKAAILISLIAKQKFPKLKIVVGGRGASSYPFGPDAASFSKKLLEIFNKKVIGEKFGQTLVNTGLADSFIEGDGEQAIIELANNSQANIVGDISKIDLETVPTPNYDDYDLSLYEYINEPTLSITGSKGCVRQCTFCDIPVLWPKFKFRSGEHIANEMLELKQRYGVNKFYMSDSLVNGSMKAFMDFTGRLAEYNTQNPDDTIRWVGQYITRPVNQIPPGYYEKLKLSGGEGLTIGAESGSNSVRKHMRKKFSTYDLDTEMAQFSKNGIVCVLLFFSSYPTETWQDFEDTCDMLMRYMPYYADSTVYKITLGIPYTHHANTPLWNMQEEIGLNYDISTDVLWLMNDNKELTFYERIRRRLILQELSFALNLPLSRNAAELNQLRYTLQFHLTKIEEFFGKCPDIKVYPDYYNLTDYDQVLMPPELQIKVMECRNSNLENIKKIKTFNVDTLDNIGYDKQGYVELKQALGEI